MIRSKPVANLEIRATRTTSMDDTEAAAFDAAVGEAATQTPEGVTRQVAFVLTWIDGPTLIGRVALERDRYAGLKAQVLELSVPPEESRKHPDELVELARHVRARARMADVQALLEATLARAAALRGRTATRTRR